MNPEIKEKFTQIRKDLRGEYEYISKKTGVSISTVSRVLNGDFVNEKVIKVALSRHKSIILKRKIESKKLTKMLSHIK